MYNSTVFPMTIGVHIGFAAVCVAVLLIGFFHNRYAYRIILAEAILCTFLVYLSRDGVFLAILGIVELIMFVLSLVLRHFEREHPEKMWEEPPSDEINGQLINEEIPLKKVKTDFRFDFSEGKDSAAPEEPEETDETELQDIGEPEITAESITEQPEKNDARDDIKDETLPEEPDGEDISDTVIAEADVKSEESDNAEIPEVISQDDSDTADVKSGYDSLSDRLDMYINELGVSGVKHDNDSDNRSDFD